MIRPACKTWIAVVALAAAGAASAQQPMPLKADVKLAQASTGDVARCRKDVRDYVETIRLLRDTAGNDTGNLVTGAFASEAELERVAQAQGPCAAAQILRDKRATR